MVLVSTTSTYFTISDFQSIHSISHTSPIRRIEKKQILYQYVSRSFNLEQPWPVFLSDQVSNTWQPPPPLPLTIQCTNYTGGEGNVVKVVEMETLKNMPVCFLWPFVNVVGENNCPIQLNCYRLQVPGFNST